MKDLMKLVNECKMELDVLGIEYATDIEFVVNTRAKKRWGQCTKHPNGTYTISISDRLLDDTLKDDSPKQTIIHELLHSVKGCMSHKGLWKELADLVTECYGCYNITRCTSANELGVTEEKVIASYKYIIECSNCGYTYKRNRKSDFVKAPYLYGCGKCGQFNTMRLL